MVAQREVGLRRADLQGPMSHRLQRPLSPPVCRDIWLTFLQGPLSHCLQGPRPLLLQGTLSPLFPPCLLRSLSRFYKAPCSHIYRDPCPPISEPHALPCLQASPSSPSAGNPVPPSSEPCPPAIHRDPCPHHPQELLSPCPPHQQSPGVVPERGSPAAMMTRRQFKGSLCHMNPWREGVTQHPYTWGN